MFEKLKVFIMEFIIYSYQFTPLIRIDENDFFCDQPKIFCNLMDQKNKIFDKVIDESDFIYRNKKYQHDIKWHKANLIIMRLANKRNVEREVNFELIKENDEPSCYILIDNNKDVQRIAIERKKKAFANTESIKDILMKTFNNVLIKKQLHIQIEKEHNTSEFWNYCNQYKGRIQQITFSYQYPNLGRAHEELKKLIKDTSGDTLSQVTKISFENKNGLYLNENKSDVIDGLVKDSSKGGGRIPIKIKGFKKRVLTGQTEKSIIIDEIECDQENVDTLFANLEKL